MLSYPFSFQGCEGRSTNPVAVFFDTLNRPDADLGQEKPSLLTWNKRPDLKVSHLCLGKGKPGGCWEVSMNMTCKRVKTYRKHLIHF